MTLQNRRSFLKILGLSSVGVVLANNVEAAPDVRVSPLTDVSIITLKGTVKANGKGVGGVAVTDGMNVTVTDAQGKYKLISHGTAEFVYISIPKGYAFTNTKGIVRFYQKINRGKDTFMADFDLQKLSKDDSRHTFIVWADPQIQNAEDAAKLHAESVPDTLALVQQYGKDALIHGIGCGDLVWDKFELFGDYEAAVEKTTVPFFQVIGNHDMDLDARTDDYSSRTFKEHFGPAYYSYNRGEIHYIVLDDVFFLGSSKKYIGYIAEQQFAWLEQDLAHVKAGSTVVVSVHIPVNTGTKRREQLKDEPIGGVVSNRKELYRMLKPYNVHIMSGHTHFNEKVFEGDNIIEHVHGAVCGAWWTGPICYDGTPGGYGVYEVNGSELTWYYKSVGYDKNYQMRTYPVGKIKEKPASFSVNVWNWDPQWKVEWLEDNVVKGEMQREVSFDPWSVELHAGADKPVKRGWVDPVLTDHIFFATPSQPTSKITVRVTDRFKNVYTQDV